MTCPRSHRFKVLEPGFSTRLRAPEPSSWPFDNLLCFLPDSVTHMTKTHARIGFGVGCSQWCADKRFTSGFLGKRPWPVALANFRGINTSIVADFKPLIAVTQRGAGRTWTQLVLRSQCEQVQHTTGGLLHRRRLVMLRFIRVKELYLPHPFSKSTT